MPNKKKTKSRSKGKPGQQSPASSGNTETPPPRPEPHRPSDLFTNSAFSGVLEQVILELPLASISSVARVCKQVNHVICDSTLLQLVLRRSYHRLPDLQSPLFEGAPGKAHIRQLLNAIIDRERRISALRPSETRCFHRIGGTVVDVRDGYILMAESLAPTMGIAFDPVICGGYDGWSVWKLPDSMPGAEQGRDPVATEQYGLVYWSAMSPGPDPIVAITFCPQDNAIIVVRDQGEQYHPSLQRNIQVHRLCVYQMRPLPGSRVSVDDHIAFVDGSYKHPNFPLPFIELLSPVGYTGALRSVKLCATSGGRVGISIQTAEDRSVAGVWDWTSGICLGRIQTGDNCSRIFDMAFLTPGWVICATMQHRDLEDDPGDWNFDIDDYGHCPCLDVFSVCGEPIEPTHPAYDAKEDGKKTAWVLGFKHEAMHMVVFHLPPLIDDDSANLTVEAFNIRCPATTSFLVEYPSGTITFALNGTRIDPHHPTRELRPFALQGCMPVGHALGLATLDLGAKTRLVKDETYRKVMYIGLVRAGLTREERHNWLKEAPVANIPWSARMLGNIQELERPLYLPWSETQARVTFNDSLLPFVPAAWGDRIVYLTSCLECCNEDPKHKSKCTGFGSGIVLQDFNPRTDIRLDRPLGGLALAAHPNAGLKTRARRCEHPNVGAMPVIDKQQPLHLCDGRTSLASEELFARGTEAFGMRNTTMSAHITWSHSLFRGLLMDEGHLVLSLDHGAVIMSF